MLNFVSSIIVKINLKKPGAVNSQKEKFKHQVEVYKENINKYSVLRREIHASSLILLNLPLNLYMPIKMHIWRWQMKLCTGLEVTM